MPSRDAVICAVKIYFRVVHRQPLWLFESEEALAATAEEDVLFAVIALSLQHSPEEFKAYQMQPPSAYREAARTLVMLSMANATVRLTTLKALALLTWSNLTGK
jgi:hypothetical protein